VTISQPFLQTNSNSNIFRFGQEEQLMERGQQQQGTAYLDGRRTGERVIFLTNDWLCERNSEIYSMHTQPL
jgi:hypothetical protein